MNKKIFNKSGIAIDFGATKISVSQIIKGKFKKTITSLGFRDGESIS